MGHADLVLKQQPKKRNCTLNEAKKKKINK